MAGVLPARGGAGGSGFQEQFITTFTTNDVRTSVMGSVNLCV